jgi:ligand-binding sensor domain-containing protein
VGAIFAMAQTPDGYLWLGTEFGLFRFDGLHAVLWQPPAGPQLPKAPYALLVTRDGTLWIGTFAGLVSWNGNKLTEYPEVGRAFVTSPLEDREGTVRAGILAAHRKVRQVGCAQSAQNRCRIATQRISSRPSKAGGS